MGKAAKPVIAVAAAVAIPFVAPAIVGAIATSTALTGTALGTALAGTAGATAGSALVGAGLGAATAAATGQNVGRGALFGGIGGGIGGYMSASAAAQAAASGTEMANMMALDASNMVAGGIGQSQVAATLQSAYGVDAMVAADVAGLASQGLSTAQISNTLASSYLASGTGAEGFTGATTGTATAGGAAAPTRTFGEALKAVPGAIADKFKDPSALADMTLRAGASILSGQLAGDGLSGEEQQLLQAQIADLEMLREQNEELFRTRVEEAMALLGEARYFDPQQFGFQAQAAVKVAGAQQLREAERAAALQPGRTGMSAADARRAGLDITARGQTAYLGAADQAQQQRLRTYQAGLAALPTSGPTAGLQYSQNIAAMYDTADRRRRQLQEDIGGWMGSITGQQNASQIG